HMGKPRVAIFEVKEDLSADTITVTLEQQYGGQHTLGRFRLSATAAPRPVRIENVPDAMGSILLLSPAYRTPGQQAELATYYRGIAPKLAERREQVAALRKQGDAIKPATTLVIQELPKPRPTFVHIRGNHKNPGDKVEPGVPAKLHSLKADGAGNGPGHSPAS